MKTNSPTLHPFSVAGLLIALGIVYGDIGTSPLYVLKAIVGDKLISKDLILGGLSCIIWTLTLQTTVKYVILALQADNKGEGGIFALFTLVRKWNNWLIFPTMIGGCAFLADGIITPCISVSSAIEGLHVIDPNIPVLPIVICILVLLFSVQQLGTRIVGASFGPIILCWFLMLSVLGIRMIINHPEVFMAINPLYAIDMLVNYPQGFWILGAVFLCTTGAEALYSDLGHCGKTNIRISWTLVKTSLILNYAGQAAWLLDQENNFLQGQNPFFAIMPTWFVPFGILIATAATIIASQALITGTFTLITEAVRLNLFPKVKVVYPTDVRGQIYVPLANFWMLISCICVLLYFQESANMEAAYGLAININMIASTILLSFYLARKRVPTIGVIAFAAFYLTVEIAFLVANLSKFSHGGWVTIFISMINFMIMWTWLGGRNLKRRYLEFDDLKHHLPLLRKLAKDTTVSKYSTHLVYLTEANKPNEIEKKIIYSLFQRQPKRADVYWFLHVSVMDQPYGQDYKVETLIPGVAYRIDFRLGFRVEPKLGTLFRQVIQEMASHHEVDITSRYTSLKEHNIPGDFRFVALKKYLSAENDLPTYERVLMKNYFFLKRWLGMSESVGFGLDTSSVTVETYPLVISPIREVKLERVNT